MNFAVVEGLDDRHRDLRMELNVPTHLRSQAELAFSQGLGQSPAFHDTVTTLPASVGIQRFRIYTPGEQRARGCLMLFLTYVFAGTVFGFVFQSQPREFQYGILPGAFAAALYLAYRGRRSRLAGPPHIRLRASTDWRGVLFIVAPAAAALYLSYAFPFTLGWFAAVIGGGVAAGCVFIFAREWRANVDLCENGIVASTWLYWPWSQIRLHSWNRTGNGRLVLSHGWLRAVATVPTSLTEEVDALLKAKIGT